MRSLKLAMVTGVALVVFGSSNVFAQASGAMSAPTGKAAWSANHQLAKKVRIALTQSKPTLPMDNIAVLARNGAITLLGEIASDDQGAQAEKIAKGVAGVTSVNNRLSIEERGE